MGDAYKDLLNDDSGNNNRKHHTGGDHIASLLAKL